MFDFYSSDAFTVVSRIPMTVADRTLAALTHWLDEGPALRGTLSRRLDRDQEALVVLLVNSCGLVILNPLRTHTLNFYGGVDSRLGTARAFFNFGDELQLGRVFADYLRSLEAPGSYVPGDTPTEDSAAIAPAAEPADDFLPLRLPSPAAPAAAIAIPTYISDLCLLTQHQVFGVTKIKVRYVELPSWQCRVLLEESPVKKRGTR